MEKKKIFLHGLEKVLTTKEMKNVKGGTDNCNECNPDCYGKVCFTIDIDNRPFYVYCCN